MACCLPELALFIIPDFFLNKYKRQPLEICLVPDCYASYRKLIKQGVQFIIRW